METYQPGLDGVILNSHGSRLLGGLYRGGGSGPRPSVLLLHGVPGVEKNLDIAYALRDAGWNALTFHYRGCWGSEGDYSLTGILDDVRAAADYLAAHHAVDAERMAVIGLSLGGWAAVAHAVQDSRFRAVVSLAPLVDPLAQPLPLAVAAEFASMLHGITPERLIAEYDSLARLPDHAPRLRDRPVLIVSGDADELFPPDHIRPLAEAMPWAEWRRVPGASHTFDAHRTELVWTVVEWLRRNNGQ